MSVRERCSCGAEFRADHPDEVKLLREWRRQHRCIEIEADVSAVHGGESKAEQALGFAIEGLDYPARKMDPWEE